MVQGDCFFSFNIWEMHRFLLTFLVSTEKSHPLSCSIAAVGEAQLFSSWVGLGAYSLLQWFTPCWILNVHVLHRLVCWNTWPPVGGIVLEPLGGRTLLQEWVPGWWTYGFKARPGSRFTFCTSNKHLMSAAMNSILPPHHNGLHPLKIHPSSLKLLLSGLLSQW